MRQQDVATAVDVSLSAVKRVSIADVRAALADRVPAVVYDVATQSPATYWFAGGRYWLDDPEFGDVVNIEQLDYDRELGLYRRG